LYFAYGSNMSRERLEARTETVVHRGHAVLREWSHSFTHLGRDGTGKGNIIETAGHEVHGVLYELSHEQFEILHYYEWGYDLVKVPVERQACGSELTALTYTSIDVLHDLQPKDEYVEHYLQGMRENRIPEHYLEFIRRQAKK
jgi:hypothetical protein